MNLKELWYNNALERYRFENELDVFEIGRIIAEHKSVYIVHTGKEKFNAEITGSLRYASEDKTDLPVVGDWVAISKSDENKALIHAVYPRYSVIERKAIGKSIQKQIIASNIDYGLIIQSVNRDFSINRLERYLTICNVSNITPIIILNKIDLIDQTELETILDQVYGRIKNVPVFPMSNESLMGIEEVSKLFEGWKSYCLLGSSGVWKSTLINNLIWESVMKTAAISESVDRWKHVTTHRELFVLKSWGIIIDNPGMRELGVVDNIGWLETTFDDIIEISENCKFKNCTHTGEEWCAIKIAFENDEIDIDSYNNFQKLQKEKVHYNTSAMEKKRKDKHLSKEISRMKKRNTWNKYTT